MIGSEWDLDQWFIILSTYGRRRYVQCRLIFWFLLMITGIHTWKCKFVDFPLGKPMGHLGFSSICLNSAVIILEVLFSGTLWMKQFTDSTIMSQSSNLPCCFWKRKNQCIREYGLIRSRTSNSINFPLHILCSLFPFISPSSSYKRFLKIR